MIINQNGGKVIASGGFGCIFYPSLKCDKQDLRDNNKISKLMTTKHAEDEYKQIISDELHSEYEHLDDK